MTPTDEKPDLAPMTDLAPQKQRATVELIKVLSAHPEHAPYMKQLIEAEAMRELFDQDYRTARMFAMSGKFDDIKGSTPEQAVCAAMTKIRIGREWGMNDSDSMSFIYFTNGRPNVATEILATAIQKAGFSWDIDWNWVEEPGAGKGAKPWRRCTGCTLWLKERDTNKPILDRNGAPVSAWFTEADAEHAEIYEKGGIKKLSEKWNFKSWPQDMYFWRAMSRLRKYYLTGVMRGAVQRELIDEEPPPPTMQPQLAAPEEQAATEAQPEKSLRDRILEAEQTELIDVERREPGEGE